MVAVAYTVFGLTGFGSTVIALPVLAHLFSLKFAVPLLLLLDFTAFVIFGARLRKRIHYAEIAWLIPFVLAGMAITFATLAILMLVMNALNRWLGPEPPVKA